MKKYLPLLSIPALMTLNSCLQEDIVKNGGQEVTAKINISLPGNGAQSRVSGPEADKTDTYTNMRLHLFVYSGNTLVKTIIKDGNNNTDKVDFSGDKTVTEEIRLVTGQPYKIVGWADFGSEYYTIENGVVSLVDDDDATTDVIDRKGNDVKNDAFYECKEVKLDANETINLKLSRPFGLVQVTTNDWNEDAVKEAGLQPDSYVTEMTEIPTQLDLLSGEVDEEKTVSFKGNITKGDDDSQKLSYDYILTNEAQSVLNEFTTKYYKENADNTEEICDYTFNSIPVQRNYITNISGNVLTKNGTLNVKIDQVWTDDIIHNITEVASVEELQDAINNAEDGDVIALKPGTYEGNVSLDDIDLATPKTITIQGTKVDGSTPARSRAGEVSAKETVFTGSLFAERHPEYKVYKDLKVVIDGITFKYDTKNRPESYKSNVGVACIGNTQYNAIGELVVRNCTFIPTEGIENLFFIGTNQQTNDECRSVIKLYNNKIGTDEGTYNSWYPVRLWNVTNVEVIGNEFIVPQGFTGLQHLNISKLSASPNASVIVKDNTFTNGNAGISISTWMLGDSDHANQKYTGKIEVSGNKFINVATQDIENPARYQVPIFISPEYTNDNIEEGRAENHGLFDTFVVVENNTYEGTPRENVIVSQKMNIKTADELKAAIKNQMDGQTWVINEGTYNMTGAPTAQTKEPDWEYYVGQGYEVSQFIVNANDINIIGENNPVIFATSNQASVSLNGQATILVRGNNVSIDGLTVKAIQYTHEEGGNKAIAAEGADELLIKNCIITPSDKGYGGLLLFDKDYSNKTARIENTSIKGVLSTGYATSTGKYVTVKDVEVSCIETKYTSPLSSNAANAINVESNFVTEVDNSVELPAYINGVPANTNIKLAAGEYENTKGVIITKPITLRGEGKNTVLKSAPEAWASLWIKKGAEGTVIDGLTVYGAYKNNGDKVSNAITIWTKNVTVKNSTTLKPDELDPTIKGYLGISTTYGDFTDIHILNNTINDARYGMYFNSLSNSTIKGNTVNGTSYGGIVIAADGERYACENVTVEGNTLTNISSEGNSSVYAYALSVPGTYGSNLIETNNTVTYAPTASTEISSTPAYGFNK